MRNNSSEYLNSIQSEEVVIKEKHRRDKPSVTEYHWFVFEDGEEKSVPPPAPPEETEDEADTGYFSKMKEFLLGKNSKQQEVSGAYNSFSTPSGAVVPPSLDEIDSYLPLRDVSNTGYGYGYSDYNHGWGWPSHNDFPIGLPFLKLIHLLGPLLLPLSCFLALIPLLMIPAVVLLTKSIVFHKHALLTSTQEPITLPPPPHFPPFFDFIHFFRPTTTRKPCPTLRTTTHKPTTTRRPTTTMEPHESSHSTEISHESSHSTEISHESSHSTEISHESSHSTSTEISHSTHESSHSTSTEISHSTSTETHSTETPEPEEETTNQPSTTRKPPTTSRKPPTTTKKPTTTTKKPTTTTKKPPTSTATSKKTTTKHSEFSSTSSYTEEYFNYTEQRVVFVTKIPLYHLMKQPPERLEQYNSPLAHPHPPPQQVSSSAIFFPRITLPEFPLLFLNNTFDHLRDNRRRKS